MLKKWILGDKGLEYVREELNNGSALAKLIREQSLVGGICETYLPEPLDMLSIPDLALSIYLSKDVSLAEGRAVFMDKIQAFLQQSPDHCALIETFHTPEKTAFIAAETLYFIHENEVFFCLKHPVSKSTLEEAIASGKVYPKIVVLTRQEGQLASGTVVTAKEMHAFARNVSFLLVGAFDEESYVAWSKRGLDHF